jgi:hypothetical protein
MVAIYIVLLCFAAGILLLAFHLLRRLLAVLRAIFVMVARLAASVTAAMAGGLVTALLVPVLFVDASSPVLVLPTLVAGLGSALLCWQSTRHWGKAAAAPAGERAPSPWSVTTPKIAATTSRASPAFTVPRPTTAERQASEPPLVDAATVQRVEALKQALDAALAHDPLDTAAVEWRAVCDRVPELIRSTEAVYADAAPAERPGLRAGLAHDLESIITQGEARVHASRRTRSTIARDQLATLRHYVAARTGAASD